MPQTHPTTTNTSLPPVPVGVLLPPPRRTRRATPAVGEPADWYGLDARTAGLIVTTYTRPADVVIDLDAHPVMARAVRALHRHPATLTTHRHRPRPPAPGRRRIVVRRPGAGLIIASLPPAGGSSGDLHAMTAAMHTWRSMLRPGGFLLVAIGSVGQHSTVITAARVAGLLYHQHLLAVRVPLPEYEPRAMADTAAPTPPTLVQGRHIRAHTDLLAFAATAGDADA
jgi:hypothetical protein